MATKLEKHIDEKFPTLREEDKEIIVALTQHAFTVGYSYRLSGSELNHVTALEKYNEDGFKLYRNLL